jgi:hypothetical protein
MVDWLVGIPFSVLVIVIKLRCMIDDYPCGFCGFYGGFTWHFWMGVVTFIGIGDGCSPAPSGSTYGVDYLDGTVRSCCSTLGRVLDSSNLGNFTTGDYSPAQPGGPCPDLPIICHDIPLFGFSGLLYWMVPFALWAVVTVWTDIKQASKERDGDGHLRH